MFISLLTTKLYRNFTNLYHITLHITSYFISYLLHTLGRTTKFTRSQLNPEPLSNWLSEAILLVLITIIPMSKCLRLLVIIENKKAQLSLTNPRDAKACQKLLQFDVLTTLSLTILAYLHAFSCCCVRNVRNPEKFTENSNFWSSRWFKVIDLGVNRKPMYDLLLVTNSNFGRICYLFRDIDA